MSENQESLRSDLFGTSVGSAAKAKAVERQDRVRELEEKIAAAERGETVEDSYSVTEPVYDVVTSSVTVPHRSEPVVDPNQESVVIKNNHVPVTITTPVGKNIMTGTDENMSITFEAHEAQVSEDCISILYKNNFTLVIPSFTVVTLEVKKVRYKAMCFSTARKIGTLTDIQFVIVKSSVNGETSNS